MKCATKSCQRNKNILDNGFCHSCNDAKNTEAQKKPSTSQKAFKIDIKEIEDMFKKLKKGENVNQNVVNSLIVGGILHFVAQQEHTEKLGAKVNELESQIKTSACRIESLENWMNKINETVKSNTEKVEKCITENVELRNKSEENHDVNPKSSGKTCDLCGETCMKNSDFENHMVEKHNMEKTYKCDECDKTFLLEWRLRKHRVNHLESLRKCR